MYDLIQRMLAQMFLICYVYAHISSLVRRVYARTRAGFAQRVYAHRKVRTLHSSAGTAHFSRLQELTGACIYRGVSCKFA
jgi:hypothetical protein